MHGSVQHFSTVDASSLEDDPSNKAQRISSLHAFSKNNLFPRMKACALEQCTCGEPIVRTSVVSSHVVSEIISSVVACITTGF